MVLPLLSTQVELRSRIGCARIVAAVHLGVAVHAAPRLGVVDARLATRRSGRYGRQLALQLSKLTAMRRVALVAQERRTHLQEAFGNRAVGVVAVAAILVDRLMAMHEGAALFHVAGVAGLDHAIALDQLRTDRTVGVVAVRAGNLSFQHRMVGGLADLGALLLVAGEAHFGLGALVSDLVLGGMQLVAGRARHIGTLVGTAFPVGTLGILAVTRYT